MIISFMQFDLGEGGLELLLVVALAVALVSSAGWLLARLLADNAALRHLVLFSALGGCVACPALVALCAAAGLAIVSIPILRTEQRGTPAPARAQAGEAPIALADRGALEEPRAAARPQPASAPAVNEPSREAALARPLAPAAQPIAARPNEPPHFARGADRFSGLGLSRSGVAAGVVLVWAAGALLMFARLGAGLRRVVQLRRESAPLRAECHVELLREAASALAMRKLPLLLVSRSTVAPLAVGCGRPAIILPQRLLEVLDRQALRDVLVHELAHVARSDPWIALLQELAGACYWPIVTVHALNRELQRAREELCDNVVLAGRDAISYGETLLRVAELLVHARKLSAVAGIIGGPGALEARVAGLIDPARSLVTTTGRRPACAVLLIFGVLCAVVSATRLGPSARASVPATGHERAASPQPHAANAGASALALAQDAAPKSNPPGAAKDDDPKPRAPENPDDPKLAGHFHGTVHGPDGKPFPGARVYVVPIHDAHATTGPVRASTDADGRFAFDAPDMTYNELDGLPARREGLLIAAADGFAPEWFQTWGERRSGFHSHWDPVKGAEVSLQLAQDDVPIHGRFLGPDGQPLAGARVRLTSLDIPMKRDLTAHLDREVKLSMFSMTDFERSLYQPQLLPGLTTTAVTDADGRFTMTGIGRDRIAALEVTAPSVVNTSLTVMTREGPDVQTRQGGGGAANTSPALLIHGAGFTMKLERGWTIRGVVRDAETHAPIPGMWVGPQSDPPLNGLLTGTYHRATDEEGRFTITGLSPRFEKREVVAISAPGMTYQTTTAAVQGDAEVMVDCPRGIPFHLKLVDEAGRPVEAEVTYVDIQPSPLADQVRYLKVGGVQQRAYDARWPLSRAGQQTDGTYQGFVHPGPGAVLVKTKPSAGYRPAHVDPKAFFAPGKVDWTAQEQITSYGTEDTLSTFGSWTNQHDYAAIVLVNPPAGSKALELAATVVKDRPRRVELVDPEGKPVVGAHTQGLTFHPWDAEPPLRASSFLLHGLHPDRAQRITFFDTDRKLIGFLLARGDADTPYIVKMQPWATLTGRILNAEGKPTQANLSLGDAGIVVNSDAEVGEHPGVTSETNGRFRIDQLVPGQRYSAGIYFGIGRSGGKAFENVVLRAGEVRDLGDIRSGVPVDVRPVATPPK